MLYDTASGGANVQGGEMLYDTASALPINPRFIKLPPQSQPLHGMASKEGTTEATYDLGQNLSSQDNTTEPVYCMGQDTVSKDDVPERTSSYHNALETDDANADAPPLPTKAKHVPAPALPTKTKNLSQPQSQPQPQPQPQSQPSLSSTPYHVAEEAHSPYHVAEEAHSPYHVAEVTEEQDHNTDKDTTSPLGKMQVPGARGSVQFEVEEDDAAVIVDAGYIDGCATLRAHSGGSEFDDTKAFQLATDGSDSIRLKSVRRENPLFLTETQPNTHST